MFNFTRALVRHTKCVYTSTTLARANYATAQITNEIQKEDSQDANLSHKTSIRTSKKQNSIVAAAFASLNSTSVELSNIQSLETPYTDEKIVKATTVNEILTISNGNGISRKHALKVVSILADWSANGKVQLSDFESDPRFLKLCKILTKGMYLSKPNRAQSSRSEDLSTIMNVTADDEAAKLVANITLSQMVKVMQTLATKKRRSTSLLRSLAFNISKSTEKLDLKQAGDLLYSMCILSFADENLLQKICSDAVGGLNVTLKKSAAVGSIVTSLGLLRYKDATILDALSNWILRNKDVCRVQDVFGMFLTLAVLNYEPANASALYSAYVPQLTETDAQKNHVWLDYVWSLVVLNQATPDHVSSVLSNEFIAELEADTHLTIPAKLKILNIQAAATYLIKNYKGTQLDVKHSEQFKNCLVRSKEKEVMVNSVLDTLKNLMQTEQYLKCNSNLGMGFYIDAECILDSKSNPVAIANVGSNPDLTKVAILILDYHDMTRGRIEPTGINALAARILIARGYKLVQVPYNEYRPRDKLIQRVQYLESKLKSVNSKTT